MDLAAKKGCQLDFCLFPSSATLIENALTDPLADLRSLENPANITPVMQGRKVIKGAGRFTG